MILDSRRLAVALCGFCAFLDLYATQAILPLFAREFRASAAAVSLTVSATTFAVALVAPFVGAIADVLGRKRIIVGATFLLAVPTALLAGDGCVSLDGSVEGELASVAGQRRVPHGPPQHPPHRARPRQRAWPPPTIRG